MQISMDQSDRTRANRQSSTSDARRPVEAAQIFTCTIVPVSSLEKGDTKERITPSPPLKFYSVR